MLQFADSILIFRISSGNEHRSVLSTVMEGLRELQPASVGGLPRPTKAAVRTAVLNTSAFLAAVYLPEQAAPCPLNTHAPH